MYPAQMCVGGTALSLYPAYFLVMSVPEGQNGPKFEKKMAPAAQIYHFSWLLQQISHSVTLVAFVLASLVNCVLDFEILRPF